jgi:hypothetical protein
MWTVARFVTEFAVAYAALWMAAELAIIAMRRRTAPLRAWRRRGQRRQWRSRPSGPRRNGTESRDRRAGREAKYGEAAHKRRIARPQPRPLRSLLMWLQRRLRTHPPPSYAPITTQAIASPVE